MLTATLTYSPSLVRSAAFAYVRRGLGAGGVVALFIVGACLASLGLSDPRSWVFHMLAGASAVLILLVFVTYQINFRQGMAKLKRMGEPHAALTLTEAEFQVRSGGGSFSMPWSTFSDVWRFSGFWLLIIGNGQYLTLPLADLSPEAQEFIAARVRPRAA